VLLQPLCLGDLDAQQFAFADEERYAEPVPNSCAAMPEAAAILLTPN
jgi:hypothetical protein